MESMLIVLLMLAGVGVIAYAGLHRQKPKATRDEQAPAEPEPGPSDEPPVA